MDDEVEGLESWCFLLSKFWKGVEEGEGVVLLKCHMVPTLCMGLLSLSGASLSVLVC